MADEKINYLEFPARNIQLTKTFFASVFGWSFTDYGPEYSAFDKQAGMEGGFYQADLASTPAKGACLVVFYSEDLDNTLTRILDAGGQIVKDTFEFPGGRRFHFTEPSGNEFAVWSDK